MNCYASHELSCLQEQQQNSYKILETNTCDSNDWRQQKEQPGCRQMKRQDLPWTQQRENSHKKRIPQHKAGQIPAERLAWPESTRTLYQRGYVGAETHRIKARNEEQNRINGRGEVVDFESLQIAAIVGGHRKEKMAATLAPIPGKTRVLLTSPCLRVREE